MDSSRSERGRDASGFALFFAGGGEEDIVKNQPVTGRILVKTEIGRGIMDKMLIILRVVAGKESKRSAAEIAVQVAHFVILQRFAEDNNVFF